MSNLDAFSQFAALSAMSGLSTRTFTHREHDNRENENAWLAVIEAIHAHDPIALSEGLRHAKGTLEFVNRNDAVKRGRLPKRAHALLANNALWANYATGHSHSKNYVNARELAWFAAPDLLPAVVEHRAKNRASAWAAPTDGFLRDAPTLVDSIERFSPSWLVSRLSQTDPARNAEHPGWAALVSELAFWTVDNLGRQREADAQTRAANKPVWSSESREREWLFNTLHAPLTLEGATIRQRGALAEQNQVRFVSDACLDRARKEALKNHWGEAEWAQWTRRAILATSSNYGAFSRQAAELFWEHCPTALFPLSLDDSVPVSWIFAKENRAFFTSERLSRWLIEAPGTGLRPAQPCAREGWANLEDYRRAPDSQPWTWVEWAIWRQQGEAAHAAVCAGRPLLPNLAEKMAPETFTVAGATLMASFAREWPQRREILLRDLERAELEQIARQAMRTPQSAQDAPSATDPRPRQAPRRV